MDRSWTCCDWLLTGLSLLLVSTPASLRSVKTAPRESQVSDHFSRVGGYLESAIMQEAPELLVSMPTDERRQLELPLVS